MVILAHGFGVIPETDRSQYLIIKTLDESKLSPSPAPPAAQFGYRKLRQNSALLGRPSLSDFNLRLGGLVGFRSLDERQNIRSSLELFFRF